MLRPLGEHVRTGSGSDWVPFLSRLETQSLPLPVLTILR